MQLDKTELVIRERTTLELFDLTLVLLRRHYRPLLLCGAVIGIPLMVANVLVTSWMVGEQSLLIADVYDSPYASIRSRHTLHLVCLWFLQYPLASLPATIFIGNQIFYDRLDLRGVMKQLRPLLSRSVIVLGIYRLGMFGLFCELFVNRQVTFEPAVELFLLVFLLCGAAAMRRASHPFAEILALENCKLRPKNGKKTKGRAVHELTYSQRSRGLHNALYGENFARFLSCSFTVVSLVLVVSSLQVTALNYLLGVHYSPGLFDHLVLPITLWLCSLFPTVFRFLSYLDARIRLEGWEVELQLKAERLRLLQALESTALLAEELTAPLTGQVAVQATGQVRGVTGS